MNKGYNIETGTQSCQGCVFQLNESNCYHNRLNKLKQYDMKRFCNLYRPAEWRNEQKDERIFSLVDIAKHESVIAIDFLVYDESGASIEAYENIATDLDYHVVPKSVTFIVNNNEVSIPALGAALRELNLTYPWKLKHFVGEEDFESAVDQASKDCRSTFIAVCSVSYDMSENVTMALDNLYNNEFKPIALVTEGTGNFFMVNRLLFESLGKNGGTYPDGELTGNIIEKITQQAHKEGRQHCLFSLEDILDGADNE